jgi:hypothetical protein
MGDADITLRHIARRLPAHGGRAAGARERAVAGVRPARPDVTIAALREVIAAIHAEAASEEERAELYTALMVMAAIDPWGHNLPKELMMSRCAVVTCSARIGRIPPTQCTRRGHAGDCEPVGRTMGLHPMDLGYAAGD